ncbi:hypothetical protein Lmor_1642 [Legionella moravica]|uniref:Uncharacterized protein n=2 Tax=Legionella moravica TaxID=39962 RepID=A0A378K0U3_9GAMM|nr:hypothetical protein Lmor_1642 [Legionella moravica]STX62879.1 Uncharacterised protein [Legionella moravica]
MMQLLLVKGNFNMMNSDDLSADIDGYNVTLSRKDKTIMVSLNKKDKSILEGKFAFYKLNELILLPIFKEAVPGENEVLVNVWHTKKAPGVIIKYATKQHLAIVFTTEGEVDEYFEQFISAAGILSIKEEFKGTSNTYFDEVRFVQCLASHHLTVEMLRHEHHFSESRISLLAEHQFNFTTLLKQGVSLQQIKEMKPELLTLINLQDILSLVTLEQITGKNHTAPPVPKMEFRFPEWPPTQGTARTFGGLFNIRYANNRCEISYRHKKNGELALMTLRVDRPQEEEKITLDAEINKVSPERLIHDWYHLPECRSDLSGFITRRLYCPELNFVITKKLAPTFPERKYDEAVSIPIGINPVYYREQRFAHFLMKKGCPLESFRKLPGMTNIKLMTLCFHHDLLVCLLKKGMVLTDFAKIDENRLLHVFDNKDSAIRALHFVKPAELFSLKQKATYCPSHQLFTQVRSEMNEPDSDDEEHSYPASSVPV